jgi:hypothetical protein
MTRPEQSSDPSTTDPILPYGDPTSVPAFSRAEVQDQIPPRPRRRWVGRAAAAVAGLAVATSGLVWANQEQESSADICASAEGEFLNPSHSGQAVDGNDGILVLIQTENVPAGCGVTVLDKSSTGYYRVTNGLESLAPGGTVTIGDQPIGSHGEDGARYDLVAVVGDATCAAAIARMEWDIPYGSQPEGCRQIDTEEISVTRP